MPNSHWYLVSSHGSVLFYIAANPDCMISDITTDVTDATDGVGIVGDLRRAGMLQVWRSGRHHHYRVNPDGPFLHPTIRGMKLRTVVGGISNGSNGSRRE
jgi:hypothetical protein